MASPSASFDPDSRANGFFPDDLDGAGGQNGPAQLAAGVGQGGLDRMQAIKPVFRLGVPSTLWSSAALRRRLAGRLGGGLGVEMAAVFFRGLWGAWRAYRRFSAVAEKSINDRCHFFPKGTKPSCLFWPFEGTFLAVWGVGGFLGLFRGKLY